MKRKKSPLKINNLAKKVEHRVYVIRTYALTNAIKYFLYTNHRLIKIDDGIQLVKRVKNDLGEIL